MNVLIMGETSAKIRDAFRHRGHNAWSCDLLPCVKGERYHILADIRDVRELHQWDILIAHPHCTYLTNSAAWAFGDPDYVKYPGVGYHQKVKPDTLVGAARRAARRAARQEALAFVEWLWRLPIKNKALENPQGCINTRLPFMPRPCVVQPHMFGHDTSKATCLWLDGLPPLVPTKHIAPRMVNGKPRWVNQTDSGQNRLSPSDDRWSKRSETFDGIAEAMADQWGSPKTTDRNRPALNPGGVECERCGRIFIGEEWQKLCAVCVVESVPLEPLGGEQC